MADGQQFIMDDQPAASNTTASDNPDSSFMMDDQVITDATNRSLNIENHPLVDKEKLQASKEISKITNMPPSQVYNNFDMVSEAWTGGKAKSPAQMRTDLFAMKKAQALTDILQYDPKTKTWGAKKEDTSPEWAKTAVGVVQEIGKKATTTQKSIEQEQKIGELSVQQMFRNYTPEREQQIKRLQSEMPSADEQFKGFPKFIMDQVESMGFQAKTGASAVIDYSMALLSGELFNKKAYVDKNSLISMGTDEALRFTGSMIGGIHQGLIDDGVDRKIADGAAVGIGVLQTALMFAPFAKIPGLKPLADEALAQALTQSALKNTFTTFAKGMGVQTAFAVASGTVGVAAPEFIKVLNNKLKGTNIPIMPVVDMVKEIGLNTVFQVGMMALPTAGGSIVAGSRLESMLHTEAEKIPETPEAKPGETKPQEAAKPETVIPVEKEREQAIRDELNKMPYSELEKEPVVPHMEQVTEQAYSDKLKQLKRDGLSAAIKADVLEHAAANTPEEYAANMKEAEQQRQYIKEIDAKIAQLTTKKETISEKTTDADREKLAQAEINKQPINEILKESEKTIEPIKSETASMTREVESDPKVTAAREALNKAAADPTQADKLKSYAEALNSARQEAKKNASLRAKDTLTRERLRIGIIKSKHKMIDDIKSLNPEEMNKDLGDVVKEIKDYFLPKKERSKQYEQKEKEINLDSLKDQLAEAEKTGDLAASIDLQTFPTRLSKLEPGQLKQVHDALLNLQHIQKLRNKVQGAEKDFERARLHEQADKNIAKPKVSLLGPDVSMVERNIHANANAVSASFDFNGEWVFGGKDNDLFKIAVRDPLTYEVNVEPRAFDYQKTVRDMLQEKFGIDERKTELGWARYWTTPFIEDGVILTRGEVMDNFMDFKNKNNRESLLQGGSAIKSHVADDGNPVGIEKVSDETYRKLFSHLTPDDIAVMDEITRVLDGRVADDLDEYSNKAHGVPLKREQNYWPKRVVSTAISYNDDIEAMQMGSRSLGRGPDESTLIKRTGSTGAIHTTGLWDKFSRSTKDSARIVEMGIPYKAARDILYDKHISDLMVRSKGAPIVKQLRKDLESIAGQRETTAALDKILDIGGNIAANADLGILSTAKAPVKMMMLGLRSFIQFGTPQSIFDTLFDLTVHPIKSRKRAYSLSKRIQTASRRGFNIDQAQQIRMQTKLGTVRAIGRKAQRENMSVIRLTSRESYNIDTVLADKETEHQFRKAENGKPFSDAFKSATGLTEEDVRNNKITPEEKVKAKGQFADMIIGETHATPDPGHMIGLQKNAVGRNIFSKFQTEPLKGGENVRRTWMQAARKPTIGNITRAMTVTVFYGLIEGAMIYGLDSAWNALFGTAKNAPQPVEELQKAALANIPIAGAAANTAIDEAKYHTTQRGAVEAIAMMPIDLCLAIVDAVNPDSTSSVKKAAWKKVTTDLASTYRVPSAIIKKVEGQ